MSAKTSKIFFTTLSEQKNFHPNSDQTEQDFA